MELKGDWRPVVEFGAALKRFMQSAGHDAAALAAMEQLAPGVEPLVGPPGERLLVRLPDLARAYAAPAADAAALAERERLESLRGQVFAAEWLLHSEMVALERQEANLGAWLYQSMASLLLLVGLGRRGMPGPAARTRRRALATDPRFVIAVRACLVVLFAVIGLLVVLTALRAVAWFVQAANG